MPQTSELPRTSWFGATLALRTLYLIAMAAFFASAESVASRSFTVKNDTFVKDGDPYTLRSGSLHYFRVPPEYLEGPDAANEGPRAEQRYCIRGLECA
jgi:hypothetical protein